MPRRSIRGAVGVLLMVVVGLAGPTIGSAQRADEPAMEAFRRQARERERERQALFDRLRKLPEVPAAMVIIPVLAAPVDDGERGEDEGDAPPAPLAMGVLAAENFDHWMFRDGAGAVGEAARRDRLEWILVIKAERTARAHKLTPAEAEKLRLAGRGDVKRFFDRVAALRREFDVARKDQAAGMAFLRSLQPERTTFEGGPFGDGSLFDKTLTRLLADRRPPGLRRR